ncbi:MAG: zf-HC2 domain-containing protein [bacterium]|nr:zf-HC2 domain-containing protein [bacterium]
MNCRYREDMISTYMDGELLPGEAEGLREHLAACPECRRRLEELSDVRGHLQKMSRVDPPAGFAARLHARLADEEQRRRNPWWRNLPFGIPVSRRPFELAGAGALVLLLALVTIHGVHDDARYTDIPLSKEKSNTAIEMMQPKKPPLDGKRTQSAVAKKNRSQARTEVPVNDTSQDTPVLTAKQVQSDNKLENRPAENRTEGGITPPVPSSPVSEMRYSGNSHTGVKDDHSSNTDSALPDRDMSVASEARGSAASLSRAPLKSARAAGIPAPLMEKSSTTATLSVNQQPFAGIKVSRDRITIEAVAPATVKANQPDSKARSEQSPAGRSLELRSATGTRQSFTLTNASVWSGNWSIFIPHAEMKGRDSSLENILSMGTATAARFEALADLSRSVIISPSYLEERDLSSYVARLTTWQSFLQVIPGIIPVNGEGYILLLPQKQR